MEKRQACVVVPVCAVHFSEYEWKSLIQCRHVLADYTVIIVKPETLDVSEVLNVYPGLRVECFPDHYFKDIYGYNRLMLSDIFYRRFLDFEYVLIHQLDAFVFRDELKCWYEKGYDYVGAPWTIKPKYSEVHYKIFLCLKSMLYKVIQKPFVLGKVGNGGFSLRRVDRFYKISISKREIIDRYLSELIRTKSTAYNEDVFWAMENPEFFYPSYHEALRFSFDLYPQICYMELNKSLPFGCHGWSKKKNIGFWKKIITEPVAIEV